MSKNKKILFIFTCILSVLFHCFVLPSKATSTGIVYINVDKNKLEKGEELEVSIYLKNNKTAAFSSDLYFDETKLEYVSGPDNTNVIGNRILYVWHDATGGKEAKEGELAKFKFKAKENGIICFTIDGEFYSQVGQLIQTNFEEAQAQIGNEETNLEKQAKEEQGNNTEKNNANLQALRINQEGIIPSFNEQVEDYYLTISNDISEIEVLAIAENPNATVEISGNTNLKNGVNKIQVQVISEDKTQKKTYTIEVTKTTNLELANTNLEILAIENTLLNPPFEANITNYTTQVSNNVVDLNILAVPEDEKATIQIIGKEDIKEGNNQIKIIVTAANGFTKREYEVIVYKRNQEEEKKQQEEQAKLENDLKEAYQIEQTTLKTPEETSQEEIQKQNALGIILLMIGITLMISLGIFYKRKKDTNHKKKE